MSWRRFSTLVYGLSPDAVFRYMAEEQDGRPQVLTAADAQSFFNQFPKTRR